VLSGNPLTHLHIAVFKVVRAHEDAAAEDRLLRPRSGHCWPAARTECDREAATPRPGPEVGEVAHLGEGSRSSQDRSEEAMRTWGKR
jgi:hypothetical protein